VNNKACDETMEVDNKTGCTNNSKDCRKEIVSPVIRGGSRGAKFLDLVRQNNISISPKTSKAVLSLSEITPKDIKDHQKENKYFKFSSDTKFNPNASPRSSILSTKRKIKTPEKSPFLSASAKVRTAF
jgi:hypothetical protein